MSFWENEPVGIIFFGGIKINAMENTSTFSVGEASFASLYSQVKNNIVSGQAYGDFDFNNLQPIASPLFDPDLNDSFLPITMPSTLGLED